MYYPHKLLVTPSDDTKLWRYLDLSHFLSLLNRQALYFASVIEFDDRWEGAIPAGSIEGLRRVQRNYALEKRHISKEVDEEKAVYQLKMALKMLQGVYGVNCWHMNEVESVAMWKLYTHGKDGVAIQTTVGRLKTCLSHEPRNIYIAQVHYHDHETLPAEELISPNAVVPIVLKRRSFRHESEVRLILDKQHDKPQEASGTTSGEAIAVDVSNLIEKIVASPDYPGWAMAGLQERVAAAGIDLTVEKSDLLRLPEADNKPT
jgi:hypothetical protein